MGVGVGVLDIQIVRLHHRAHLFLFSPSPFLARAACLPNPLLQHSNLVYFDRSSFFSPSALLIGREVLPSTGTSTSDHAREHSGNLAWHLLELIS